MNIITIITMVFMDKYRVNKYVQKISNNIDIITNTTFVKEYGKHGIIIPQSTLTTDLHLITNESLASLPCGCFIKGRCFNMINLIMFNANIVPDLHKHPILHPGLYSISHKTEIPNVLQNTPILTLTNMIHSMPFASKILNFPKTQKSIFAIAEYARKFMPPVISYNQYLHITPDSHTHFTIFSVINLNQTALFTDIKHQGKLIWVSDIEYVGYINPIKHLSYNSKHFEISHSNNHFDRIDPTNKFLYLNGGFLTTVDGTPLKEYLLSIV